MWLEPRWTELERHKVRSESSREVRSLRTCSTVGPSAFIPKQWEHSRSSEQLDHYRLFCVLFTQIVDAMIVHAVTRSRCFWLVRRVETLSSSKCVFWNHSKYHYPPGKRNKSLGDYIWKYWWIRHKNIIQHFTTQPIG